MNISLQKAFVVIIDQLVRKRVHELVDGVKKIADKYADPICSYHLRQELRECGKIGDEHADLTHMMGCCGNTTSKSPMFLNLKKDMGRLISWHNDEINSFQFVGNLYYHSLDLGKDGLSLCLTCVKGQEVTAMNSKVLH